MLAALLFLALSSPTPSHTVVEGSPAAERKQIVVLDLPAGNLDPSEVALLNGLVVQALSRHPELQVLSSRDIKAVLDIEAEKQALGCDSESCLAEIAGAMGARYVVYGQVGRLGSSFLLQLNLFDSVEGQSLSRENVDAMHIGTLGRQIAPTVDRLVASLVESTAAASSLPPSSSPEEGGLHAGVFVTGAGAIAAVGGVVLAGVGLAPLVLHGDVQTELASLAYDEDGLRTAKSLQAEAAQHNASWTSWGAPLAVVGAVLVTTGLVMAAGGATWAVTSGAE